jgi:hypothetical protein
MNSNYFIRKKDGRRLGPFDLLQIKNMAKNGFISNQDEIKKANGPWIIASRIRNLFSEIDIHKKQIIATKCSKCSRLLETKSDSDVYLDVCLLCQVEEVNSKPPNENSVFVNPFATDDATPSLIKKPNILLKRYTKAFLFLSVLVFCVCPISMFVSNCFMQISEMVVKQKDSQYQSQISGKWINKSGDICFFPDETYVIRNNRNEFNYHGNYEIKNGVIEIKLGVDDLPRYVFRIDKISFEDLLITFLWSDNNRETLKFRLPGIFSIHQSSPTIGFIRGK